MRSMTIKFGTVVAALLLLAGTAAAADEIGAGRVKGVNADKREFSITDATGKDFTFKLSDQTVMNRGGKESQSDLSAGDTVYVQYEKGLLTWTAKYILIPEGLSKNWELTQGKLKGYEEGKDNITYTADDGKDSTYSIFGARVWVNHRECTFDDLKIGDAVLVIVDSTGGKPNLKWVMVERK